MDVPAGGPGNRHSLRPALPQAPQSPAGSGEIAGGSAPKRSTIPPVDFDDFDEDEQMPKQKAAPLPAKTGPARTGTKTKISALEELDSLIGLTNVKKKVRDKHALVKSNQMRKRAGLAPMAMNHHMVFTGNPGTGKTTVARILGEIFLEAGLLSSGHVVEIGARELVGQYTGQTLPKVDKIVAKAMGGVLFIDEAYSLLPKDPIRDFGPEALARLLQHIDDYFDQFMSVITIIDVVMFKLFDGYECE